MTQRKITTTEQVDRLPNMAVLLLHTDRPIQIRRDIQPDPINWHWVVEGGPATVLWEPTR